MLRITATLAFMVTFDLIIFDGRYTYAFESMVLSILHHL
jgi:hypothetical protein